MEQRVAPEERQALIDGLRRRLPGAAMATDGLGLLTTDIFYVAAHPPLARVTPRNAGEVQALVAAARDLRLSLATRGAGLSYSAGYIPADARTVVVDMTAMDRIVEIDVTDRHVTVESGVTWAALHDALRPLGLTTPFWGTFSGRNATIGASLAQGAKFYGSGHRGTSAESVLGLKVVTGTGDLLVTGSAATTQAPSPFFRNYGPDLTGLFLGDCGAFGIKVEATLQLIPAAGAVETCSYSFDDPAALLRTMGQVGAEMLATECLASDPFTARSRMTSQGLRADLAVLGEIVRGAGSLASGLRDAAQIAVSGRRFASRLGYLMSCIAEGRDRADAASRIRRIRRIAADAGGRRVPASVPKVMRAMPFPPNNGLLTPSAKRMNWLHTVLPNSRAADCFAATEAVFAEHADAMRSHGIDRGYLLSAHGPTGVGIETLIRWSDAPLPIHTHYLTEAERTKLRLRKDNPAARAAVVALSDAILARWTGFGGVHMQIGRKYPYFATRLPATQALLLALKRTLDPDGVINPHNVVPAPP
jgi:FAD/FMN-containing dehydrogenase